MRNEAVALCRVSGVDQRVHGSSLESQQKHVLCFASEKLSTEIDRLWSLDISSKAGKNVKRKDLMEIREYCKRHKYIKYFIVDKVNRLMREIKMFYWFIQELEFIGVKTFFADPGQQDLNGDDQAAHIKMFLAIYQAEEDNKERMNTCITRMKDKVLLGYHLFPIPQGYRKSNTPGIPEPDEPRFSLLKEALANISEGKMNKYEALALLNKKGYKTPTGKTLRIDKFEANILKNDFYAGFISVKKWGEKFQKIKGLHKAMLTKEQHDDIIFYLKKRKTFVRKTHNPEFPLANLFGHNCGGRFTGAVQSNGKGNHYPKYRCRGCDKQFHREEVHKQIAELLKKTTFDLNYKEEFVKTLGQVWREEEKSNLDYVRTLQKRKTELEEKKNNLIVSLAENPALGDDIKLAINKIKNESLGVETQIVEAGRIENDLVNFIDFSLDFVKNTNKYWWKLDYNDRSRCKQIIFLDEIILNSHGKVCTPKISPILRFVSTKKEPEKVSDSLLVELVRKSLHMIVEESHRWRNILYSEYSKYKLQSQHITI